MRHSVEDLTHGQLSPVLLPAEILELTLTDIQSQLRRHTSSYISILLEQTAARYYRSHSFVAARQGSNLLIAMNFPLSADHLDFTLYQIQSFPVPVPGNLNTIHVAEIQYMPYGVAFRSTEAHYEYLIF